ncbi:hypothetical protein [Wohlfahrtiimonas chitiniclastica]|uniref:hypothetical protein n=1 Tax=Wohlfahrtiimonas chitiniclastica TaxID=400946 RepID=UPI000360A0E4|nr:hypothetical protein [Wohlfahrtiimonas chitiniclastica]
MKSEKCWRHKIYGIILALIVVFLICMFLFPSVGVQQIENCIHRHGSLIAGLIALGVAFYTVSAHKAQAKKELAEKDRKEALIALMDIEIQVKFLSNELLQNPVDLPMSKTLEAASVQLFRCAVIVDNYLMHSQDEVAKLQSDLILKQSLLFQRYLLHIKVLKQYPEMLKQETIRWRAEELNEYLRAVNLIIDELNMLDTRGEHIDLYESNSVFKKKLKNNCDVGQAFGDLHRSVIIKLIEKVRRINEIR